MEINDKISLLYKQQRQPCPFQTGFLHGIKFYFRIEFKI